MNFVISFTTNKNILNNELGPCNGEEHREFEVEATEYGPEFENGLIFVKTTPDESILDADYTVFYDVWFSLFHSLFIHVSVLRCFSALK